MYSVLIVEDEMLVRLGLKNLMDWAAFDMRVIADVANGQTAWEVYEKERPDIIITDLKMPVMDGMELIAKIREKDKGTRIIILSCVGEFELAQKAMSLGVSDYILKLSMTEEDIGKVLHKIQKELEEKNASSRKDEIPDANHRNVLKKELLDDFLVYRIFTQEQFAEKIRKLSLRLEPRHMVLCVMEIDRYEDLKVRFQDADGKLIKLSFLNVLDEILSNWNRGEVFFDSSRHYILIFSFGEMSSEQAIRQEIFTILNNIRSFIEKYFNHSVTFGISNIKSGYEALGTMYKEGKTALEKKYFKGMGKLLYPGSEDFDALIREKMASLYAMKGILKLHGEGGFKEYESRIRSFLKKMPAEVKQFKEFFFQLAEWAYYSIRSKDSPASGSIQSYLQSLQESDTLDTDIASFELYIDGLNQNMGELKPYSIEIARAVQFIKKNFTREISLQEVAEQISLSPGYLSSLFKKELKINFIEYLNDLRIEKAKELLINTYLKAYEISEKVGFSDSTYFSKVFKKITGSGPNEYRRKYMKESTGEPDNENNQKN